MNTKNGMLLLLIRKVKKRFFLTIAVAVLTQLVNAQNFIHPGILHSREDLERMKKAVANKEEPVYSGYQVFIQNPASLFTYKMQGPMQMVGRNPTVGQGTYDNDANAAHQNAVMWAITGDKQYADKAIEIINAWSSTLTSVTGRDAVLMAGLGPFKMVNAAEIIRYTNAGWSGADIEKTEKHFKEVIYPVLKDFAPFANGNWDAAAIKTVMAIGVFCNDAFIFERGLRYYVNGTGNGRLTNYVINDAGQIQESGRDQGHTQLGIGLLAECCEIAWHQGLDLYSYADNRLLKGFEYVARFNLGNDVPFSETLDRTGKYHHVVISQQDRGRLRAVYEQVYNHYVNIQGITAPFTKQAAEKVRPEGPGRPGADHPGYGTLFFSRAPEDISKKFSSILHAPGGLIATGSSKEINLTWVKSVGATHYSIERSTKRDGIYMTIATHVKESNYVDKKIKAGTLYYYMVSASNGSDQSTSSYPTGINAGLPTAWRQADIGNIPVAGNTLYNGDEFVTEGSGMGVDSVNDSFHFTWMALTGDGRITVRFVPQPSSQFSEMGLMIRSGVAANAPHVSLLLYPGKTGQAEAPNWHVRFLVRDSIQKQTEIKYGGNGLTEPVVTYGRMTGYCWLRLEKKGNVFSGHISYDGKTWMEAGNIVLSMKQNLMIGIPVCSGMMNSSTITFDNMSVSGTNLPKTSK